MERANENRFQTTYTHIYCPGPFPSPFVSFIDVPFCGYSKRIFLPISHYSINFVVYSLTFFSFC